MDSFDEAKREVLGRLGGPDRSRRGRVDDQAWPFIDTVNSLRDFYTTSSCAGRVNLFREPESGKKHEAGWLFVTHDVASKDDVVGALRDPPAETVWLRMEAPIFHVACRDGAAAERLLRVCQSEGWKRSGITSMGGRSPRQRRVMVEILANERLDTPVAVGGELLFDEKYVGFLVSKANEKLVRSRRRLEKLRVAVERALATPREKKEE
ncbi:MAG: tRNA wybutosine-synthesizing 3 family protein [Candidatus Woesearchaeota archaeon]